MKKWIMVTGIIVLMLGGIIWVILGEENNATKPKSHTVTSKETPSAQHTDVTAPVTDAPATAEENTRTHPSHPPAPRDYPKPQLEYPVATQLEGKPGFVMSPFNNKVVDVTGIPQGTLVQDPSFPSEEKKFFRVP